VVDGTDPGIFEDRGVKARRFFRLIIELLAWSDSFHDPPAAWNGELRALPMCG
jgi:hypothetical protein